MVNLRVLLHREVWYESVITQQLLTAYMLFPNEVTPFANNIDLISSNTCILVLIK
jgi:hypothetical protein